MNSSGGGPGFNYGALLEGYTTDSNGNYVIAASDITKADATDSFYTIDIDSSNGIKYNMVYLPTTKSGTNTFVRPTAKFLAELIKDSTGTIVGICFTSRNDRLPSTYGLILFGAMIV